MPVTLANIIRGANLKPTDFVFDDEANLIKVSTAAGSSVKAAIDAAVASGSMTPEQVMDIITSNIGTDQDAQTAISGAIEGEMKTALTSPTANFVDGGDNTKFITPETLAASLSDTTTSGGNTVQRGIVDAMERVIGSDAGAQDAFTQAIVDNLLANATFMAGINDSLIDVFGQTAEDVSTASTPIASTTISSTTRVVPALNQTTTFVVTNLQNVDTGSGLPTSVWRSGSTISIVGYGKFTLLNPTESSSAGVGNLRFDIRNDGDATAMANVGATIASGTVVNLLVQAPAV